MKNSLKITSSLLCVFLLGCGGGGSGTIAQPATNATSFTAKTTSEISTMSSADQVKAVVAAKKPDKLLDDPEAMKRILGEDKDNDGIRDDMAEWIEKNAEDKDQRSILRAAAREFQRELKIRTLDDASDMFSQGSNAGNCIYALAERLAPGRTDEEFKKFDNFLNQQNGKVKKMVKTVGKNTIERYWRYEDAQKVMHGLIMHGKTKEIADHPERYCAQD